VLVLILVLLVSAVRSGIRVRVRAGVRVGVGLRSERRARTHTRTHTHIAKSAVEILTPLVFPRQSKIVAAPVRAISGSGGLDAGGRGMIGWTNECGEGSVGDGGG
jgi:hypothetical protein